MREALEPELESLVRRGTPAASRGHAVRIRVTGDEVARTAQALIAAYGPDAAALMRRRLVSLRRRGDHETAALWHAIAEAVEQRLALRGAA